MFLRIRRGLTFANVTSLLALFVALGGVSYAATGLPAHSVGTTQLRSKSVTLAKIAPAARAALKGARGAIGPIGPAGAPGAPGPKGDPGAPGPGTVQWALINGAGAIVAQSGGITASRTGAGSYVFDFHVAVTGKAIVATPNPVFTNGERVDVTAGPCGTNGGNGDTNCGPGLQDGQHVFAETADSRGDERHPGRGLHDRPDRLRATQERAPPLSSHRWRTRLALAAGQSRRRRASWRRSRRAPHATARAHAQSGGTLDVIFGRSREGRPIIAVHTGDETGRTVLVFGSIHGNETAGIAIANAIINEPVTSGTDIWVVPDLNPDGTARDTRQNADGVDLNRNFPYRWQPSGRRRRLLVLRATPAVGARDALRAPPDPAAAPRDHDLVPPGRCASWTGPVDRAPSRRASAVSSAFPCGG